ncbi:Crp/Fnr family transcriptional regulator [Tateyamaria sp. syn59]|uniref:Crp/Fnr family transcriptional regulator n=1 Tax=Tateyamaria sp. syn59 TaxID=2576942 RepID=UPI0011BD4F41|nr:Crp/Fnr family transcriptional regulator [Tateyamaria sp. syn59]
MTQQSLADYADQGDPIAAPDGACLFRPGDEGRAFLIVQSGVVRVEQTNAAGRTVVLYRVHAGDSCVLTTTCLLSGRPYSGYGYAEGAVTAVAISAARFQALMARDAGFRELVFRGFAQRVGELTDVIDALLLHRTDLKLARWLSGQPATVARTQQDIAQELGTAREVVSRTLKSFERQGWIAVERGTITVLDRAALENHGLQDGV